ncbi:MAG TPA: hypothetical protein VKK79_20935 [Candidatus Lokiarchaeia archaeon]|nr:hypothetical protein [Candidatus Lokiarchaeia archaeon]
MDAWKVENGEAFFQDVDALESEEVYLIPDSKVRKLYLWAGKNCPKLKLYAAGTAATKLKSIERLYGYEIVRVDEGSEPDDFISEIFDANKCLPSVSRPAPSPDIQESPLDNILTPQPGKTSFGEPNKPRPRPPSLPPAVGFSLPPKLSSSQPPKDFGEANPKVLKFVAEIQQHLGKIAEIVQQLAPTVVENESNGESEDTVVEVPSPTKLKVSILDMPEVMSDERFVGDENYVHVYTECQLCGGKIRMPVPKRIVTDSELPIVPVTYIHGPPSDRHAIMVELDHDFEVRRARVSQLVDETPYP